jgi:hypothetical protein
LIIFKLSFIYSESHFIIILNYNQNHFNLFEMNLKKKNNYNLYYFIIIHYYLNMKNININSFVINIKIILILNVMLVDSIYYEMNYIDYYYSYFIDYFKLLFVQMNNLV